MAEGQNPELIEFLSQLEIRLAISGVDDVASAFREIIGYEKKALKNISELKKRFGGFDGAIKNLVNSHKKRGMAAKKASKDELSSQSKLLKGYKSLTREIGKYTGGLASVAKALVIPVGFGASIKAALNYNKSLIEISSSVNRLGYGLGYLEKSLLKVSKETTLTRMETMKLFHQYQEDMRFISLQQFEKLIKRITAVVGADAQAIGKMKQAVTSLSKEYPSLVAGLIDMSDAEKEAVQNKIRSLYLIGKIGDAQYKQISAYIRGNKQMTAGEKESLRIKKEQIEAANEFKRQWEAATLFLGERLLPIVQELADWLKMVQEYTKDWELSLTKIIALYAGLKVTGMVLPMVGGAVAGKVLGAGAAGAGVGAVATGSGAGILGGITLAGAALAGAITTAVTVGVYSIATLVSDTFAEKQASWGWMQSMLGAGSAGDFTKTEARMAEIPKKKAAMEKKAEEDARMSLEKNIKDDVEMVKDKGVGATFGVLGKEKIQKIKNVGLAKKGVEAAEANLSAGRKNSKELRIAKDLLRDANNELESIIIRQENITGLMGLQGTKAEKLKGFYQAQVGEVDALIEKMSITGDIDMGKIFKAMDAPLKTLDEEISARRTLIKFLEIGDKQAIKEAAANKDSSKAIRETFKIYAGKTEKELASLDIVTEIAKQEAIITKKVKERSQFISKAPQAYSKLLSLTQELATGMSLTVQLADNYAIGIGASVEVRKREYNALEDVKNVLKDRLEAERQAYIKNVSQNGVTKENLGMRKDMVATQNELTRASIQQASVVKSMRDAWVSAISAMNTGAGSFTELIMNAEQNTAQVTQLRGAVRSSASGATAMRDSFGRIVENVGYRGSSRMNVRGQISRRGGGKLSDVAYETGRPYGHNTARAIELLLRGETSSAVDALISGSSRVGRGNPTALAAGANKYVLSAQAGQGSFTSSVGYQSPKSTSTISSINLILDDVHIHVDKINGIDDFSNKVGAAMKKKMGEVAADAIGKYNTN